MIQVPRYLLENTRRSRFLEHLFTIRTNLFQSQTARGRKGVRFIYQNTLTTLLNGIWGMTHFSALVLLLDAAEQKVTEVIIRIRTGCERLGASVCSA